jgi:hypothetical protein
MRSRDDDPTAPVDVGYAAQWYAPDPADPEKWEEGLECGHWVAEEDPRNGDEPLPEYHFGSTLPHPRANLSSLVNRKMLELWSRAGRGPVYILNHSASSDYTRLGALGIPVAGWLAELDPVEWSRPAHAAPEALGKRILLDTALLWGAVEKGQPGDTTEPSSGVSTRSVKEILEIMESGEFTAMDNENNSGNKAMLTYILFHTCEYTVVFLRVSAD